MCEGCYEYDDVKDSEESEEQTLSELISERVDRGIAFLNEDLGEAWAFDVSLYRLNLSHTQHCVIGQLYASRPEGFDGWHRFHGQASRDLAWMTDHGFDDIVSSNYDYLTREWKIRIEELIKP